MNYYNLWLTFLLCFYVYTVPLSNRGELLHFCLLWDSLTFVFCSLQSLVYAASRLCSDAAPQGPLPAAGLQDPYQHAEASPLTGRRGEAISLFFLVRTERKADAWF